MRASSETYRSKNRPYDVKINENTARTLEYAYNDWCIYQLAKELKRPEKEILLKEVQQIAARQCSRFTYTVQEVLVESVNDHDPSLMTGRMGNNLLVHFPGETSMIGKLISVHLKECRGFYYIGEVAQ